MEQTQGTKLQGENGKYTLVSYINEGGFGEVWKATNSQGVEVAVKLLLTEHKDKSNRKKDFIKEGLALSKLNHDHILKAYDLGFDEKDEPFIVMELMNQGSLYNYLNPDYKQIIEKERALEIILDVASALSEAHRNDIVHCDIHPGNILFDRHGNVKLSDFGIAKVVKESPLHEQIRNMIKGHNLSYAKTSADNNPESIFEQMQKDSARIPTKEARSISKGKLFSNICYASPEVLFSGVAKADECSDIYSLSYVAYQLFRNFGNQNMRRAIGKNLHPEPKERSQSVTELVADLKAIPDYARNLKAYLGRDLLKAEDVNKLAGIFRKACAEEPEDRSHFQRLVGAIEAEQREKYSAVIDDFVRYSSPEFARNQDQIRPVLVDMLSSVRAFKSMKK